MVNLYATLIINKRRTFDQVPEKFKADVEAKLLEYGYDTNGDPIAEDRWINRNWQGVYFTVGSLA